ncbi:MAG: anti-sigma factor [Gammaproteobacteria bacterium]
MDERFAEWAALYAVDALDSEDLARFEERLAAGDAECKDSVYELTAVAAMMPRALPGAALRPEVRARLMTRIAADTARPSQTSKSVRPSAPKSAWGRRRPSQTRQRYAPWAGGMAAAALTGIIVWGYYDRLLDDARLRSDGQRAEIMQLEAERVRLTADIKYREQELAKERALIDLVSAKDGIVASLSGAVPSATRAYGWVMWSPEKKHGFMVAHFLPPLPKGKQYQLWAIADKRPLPAGVFDVDTVGHNALSVQVNAAHPDLFAITVEPAGGLPAPSGRIVMKGVRL